MELKIRENKAKSILTKSGITDYAFNPYVGCMHGCIYCYARFIFKFKNISYSWGKFIEVKINCGELLKKEVNKKKGEVFISSICDAWQPIESKYQLTRYGLKLLVEKEFPLDILTKSILIKRDFDILRDYPYFTLGFTITNLQDKFCQKIEPFASPPTQRLKTLEEAGNLGIKTGIFLGPLLPLVTDTEENIDCLFKMVSPLPLSYIYIDRLNLRYGVWPSILSYLKRENPPLIFKYRQIFFNSEANFIYEERLKEKVKNIAKEYNLQDRLNFCF